jgi:ABC-2 type transport system permease protein
MEGAPGVTDLIAAPLFATTGGLLLFFAPLLTMRLFSEEYRTGSYSLLQSAPLSLPQIVLGKFVGILGFFSLMLLLTLMMPLSLTMGASLDWGKVAAAVLGLGLLAATYAAIGLYLSSLTHQPGVAAVASYGLLLFLWIVGLAGTGEDQSGSLFQWLSPQTHLEPLLRGLVRSSDLAYFGLCILASLLLTLRGLDQRRREA